MTTEVNRAGEAGVGMGWVVMWLAQSEFS